MDSTSRPLTQRPYTWLTELSSLQFKVTFIIPLHAQFLNWRYVELTLYFFLTNMYPEEIDKTQWQQSNSPRNLQLSIQHKPLNIIMLSEKIIISTMERIGCTQYIEIRLITKHPDDKLFASLTFWPEILVKKY